jgi:hypothetical protein
MAGRNSETQNGHQGGSFHWPGFTAEPPAERERAVAIRGMALAVTGEEKVGLAGMGKSAGDALRWRHRHAFSAS